ncbi:MAG: hypothetical protein IJZ39_04645 [Oscillospiraceae bacterium]|nr:hypothetical protein [Oscillospiraceae bacterium]
MSLAEQVYAQAMLLAGDLTVHQSQILSALCMAACASLTARLRDGLRPEDCKADFIAAASLLALAALNGVDEDAAVEQITAGDLTIRKGSRDAAANCLRAQAELMITPYLKDRFSFQGV